MFWVLSVFAVGCGPAADQQDTEATDTGSYDTGPHETGGGDWLGCPSGMVGVPSESPGFCIDRFEASLAEDGSHLLSVEGVLPAVQLTFDDARALCSATPVRDADGEQLGVKRLATWNEWRDSADGVVGEGGATYPTGEEWPETECAVTDTLGEPWLTELQATGSFPECVSAFGVFDQLGNAWEWSDPELDISIEAFVDDQQDAGRSFAVDDSGVLSLSAGEKVGDLVLEIPGLQARLGVADDGQVYASQVIFQAFEPFDYHGYVIDYARESDEPGWMLPVAITRVDEVPSTDRAPLTVRLSEDGEPVAAKVGCAWYTGGPEGCPISARFVGHPHDFNGTIGVRCSADPIAL